MITELPPVTGHDVAVKRNHGPFGILFKDLERPGDIFRDLGPNWFASVMGTGIVANAAVTLPFRVAGLHVFALVVWALAAACWIPYLMMTRHEIAPDGAFRGWLMPVVPPMVSAANGALLVPYAAAGQVRLTLLYGVPTWGFAMVWLVIAAAITLRTARSDEGLPFGLTWWSFTFPVGTCVTGTIGLAARTGADLLRYGAAGLFVLLLAAWLIVAIRTVHGTATGSLLLPAAAPKPE